MSVHAHASAEKASTVPLQSSIAAKSHLVTNSSSTGLLLQRKCACGSSTASLTGECGDCKSKKLVQTKLTIGPSNDPLEQEADRVADQVLAAPANPAVSSARPKIHRFTGQPSASAGIAAPASVDRVLSSSGTPLEPTLRQDMEQRFSHDFSRVRVHSDVTAEQSARDVNAHAYTVGHHVAFGTGRYNLQAAEGRKLLVHELAHVVQQDSNAHVVQRWASCFEANPSGKDCPDRETGEEQHARADMVFLSVGGSDAAHALIANFDIGKSTIKSNLLRTTYWQKFLKALTMERSRWHLLGFTDCHEAAAGKTSLGKDRAVAVRTALPEALQSQIVSYDAAPAGDCMRGNVTGADRTMNRSVAFVLEQISVDFSDDEDAEALGDIVGHTPEDRLAECERGARVKTFPFRTTRFGGAPIMAHREGDEIVVKLPMHVKTGSNFRKEVATLPDDTFLSSGTRLLKNEIVRVRHYEVPHWYNFNLSGDASGDNTTEYCVAAETMLDFASATDKAFGVNVAVTVVEAVTPLVPWGKVAAPVMRAGRSTVAAAMIGTAEVAPTALGGVASRATATMVAGQVERQAVKQVVTSAVGRGAGEAVASQVFPATAQAVTSIAPNVAGSVAGAAAAEAAVQGGGDLLHSAVRSGINWNPFRGRSLSEYLPLSKRVTANVPGAAKPNPVEFLGLETGQGGRVWVSTDSVNHYHIEDLVKQLQPGSAQGKAIEIVTGTHGSTAGYLSKEINFLVEDYGIAPSATNITIHNVATMTNAELKVVLQSGGEVILAWCDSEFSRRVVAALGMNLLKAPF